MPVADKINAAYPVQPEANLARERLIALMADDPKAQKELGTLGAMLAQPALRPLRALGPEKLLPIDKAEGFYRAAVAKEANVAVWMDNRSKASVVQLPGGELIAKLGSLGSDGGQGLSLSPNGRVVARQVDGYGSAFMDAATGQVIWSTTDTEWGRFLAWLPGVKSLLLSDRQGDVWLADGVKGVVAPQPISVKHTTCAVALPGSKPRLLMGSSNKLMLLEHVRDAKGVSVTEIAHFNLPADKAITSTAPVPMMGGRMVVYTTGRDMAWLDLDSGDVGSLRITPFFQNTFAKLDEQHVILDSYSMQGRKSLTWVMDVGKQTVAQAGDGMDKGLLIPFGDRPGYFRRGADTLLADAVAATGEAQDLSGLVAEYDLQLQMAKLEAASRQPEDVSAAPGWVLPVSPPGGRDADTAAAMPGLQGVPANAEVHIVGVYESKNRSSAPLRVIVKRTARPIVLVLASYEAVNWQVVPAGGQVAAVLLSGYVPSTVSGAGQVPLLRIGSTYAYATDGKGYQALRQAVTQYTRAREIRSFQGAYSGVEFAVGGTP